MRIINDSIFRTEDLRAITLAVAEHELDAYQRRGFGVRFLMKGARVRKTRVVRRGARIGEASIAAVRGKFIAKINRGSTHVRVWLTPALIGDPRRLAHVLAHEMAHSRGMKHAAMRGAGSKYWWPAWDKQEEHLAKNFGYVHGLPLREKPKPDVDMVKLAEALFKITHAEKMIVQKERAIARQQKLVKKWKRRAKALRARHEKLAASSAPKENS